MRYGNKNLFFFGKLIIAPDTFFISVYRTENGRLRLRAGKVHGVDTDDEFALCLFDVSERILNQMKEGPVILRVETVRSLESDPVEVSPTTDHNGLKGEIDDFRRFSENSSTTRSEYRYPNTMEEGC